MLRPRSSSLPFLREYEKDAEYALEVLLSSHNDGELYPSFELPQLAIVTCMDFRINLRLPDRFAFVLRTGGANVRPIESYLAFSVARTGIHAIAIIGHTDCAMEKPDPYLVDALPTTDKMRAHYRSQIAFLAIRDARAYTLEQTERLEAHMGLPIIPLLYRVEDHQLERL